MSSIALAAYSLWILLAASVAQGLLRPVQRPDDATPLRCASPMRQILACAGALAAFFLLPAGSLPPFWNLPWGIWGCIGCLAASLLLSRRFSPVPLCLLTAAACTLYATAQEYGYPGGLANGGTYVATPFWESPPLAFCLLIITLGGICLYSFSGWLARHTDGGYGTAMQALLFAGFLATAFVPVPRMATCPIPDVLAAGLDFLLFWIKIFTILFLATVGSRLRKNRSYRKRKAA